MLDRLFGRGKASPPSPSGDLTADERIRKLAIEQQRASDPLFPCKAAAGDIKPWLMQATETNQGVHVESLFVSLGALAGFASQLAARHSLRTLPHQWAHPWAVANGADGRTYYLGDAINHFLLEDRHSFWSIAAGILPQLDNEVPDLGPIVTHVAGTIGGESFGNIRCPEGTSAGDTPENYVRHFWPPVVARLERIGTTPDEWPAAFGLVAQDVIALARDVVAPQVTLAMMMESAIAMAKLDPAAVGLPARDPAG